MLDKIFVDKSTGERVRIINEEKGMYVLDNSVRIKTEIFPKRYDEETEIDPNSFFTPKYNDNDPLAAIANQIKNLDPNKISNESAGTQVKYTPPVILSDNSRGTESVVKQQQVEESIILTPEQKKQMLEEWRRTQPGAQIPEVQAINYDDDERFLNGDKPIVTKAPEPKVDPIQMMFKMFKSNYPVKLNIEIQETIPNPNFIGMIQENVDADAIDYYAKLISDKFLADPSKFKDEIYKQLKKIVNRELGIEDVDGSDLIKN